MLPGTIVGCSYRWPYDCNHPDCWMPPHKGTVLALDDPRAWTNTLAFPGSMYPNGPTQEQTTKHVQKCLAEGLLTTNVPVLYENTCEPGKTFLQWDGIDSLRPYAEELKAWENAREEKRK